MRFAGSHRSSRHVGAARREPSRRIERHGRDSGPRGHAGYSPDPASGMAGEAPKIGGAGAARLALPWREGLRAGCYSGIRRSVIILTSSV